MKKLVIAGLRHGHIYSLYDRAMKDAGCQIAAVCEEDAAARSAARPDITVNYDSITRMLAEVPCDAVAIGDYYGKRGAIAIEALKAGKHVISDKPLCTSLDELARIEAIAKEKGLKVGCMLDVRTAPPHCSRPQSNFERYDRGYCPHPVRRTASPAARQPSRLVF